MSLLDVHYPQIFTCELPFTQQPYFEGIKEKMAGGSIQKPVEISGSLWSLLQRCLNYGPDERPPIAIVVAELAVLDAQQASIDLPPHLAKHKLENKIDPASGQVEGYALDTTIEDQIEKRSKHNLEVHHPTIENEAFEAESVTIWPKKRAIPR